MISPTICGHLRGKAIQTIDESGQSVTGATVDPVVRGRPPIKVVAIEKSTQAKLLKLGAGASLAINGEFTFLISPGGLGEVTVEPWLVAFSVAPFQPMRQNRRAIDDEDFA